MIVNTIAEKYNKGPCSDHEELKLESRRRTKSLRLSLQISYFDKALQNATTIKRKWKVIKEFWPHIAKQTKIDKISESTSDEEKAEILNKFFAEIAINLAEKIPSHDTNPTSTRHRSPVFELCQLELVEIANLMKDLKPSTSCRVDGLMSRIVKSLWTINFACHPLLI